MLRQDLDDFFGNLLCPTSFKDYCPNGLQIEGKTNINRIAFAVSATRDSIEKSILENADTLVVHHGLFWKFHGARPITGSFGKRVTPLILNQMNLFAYHLPLDAHPDIGNAAVLGKQLNVHQQSPFGDFQGCATGIQGVLSSPLTADDLKNKLKSVVNHDVIVASPDRNYLIRSVGIITGGANSDWLLAVQTGLDAYITGEISEHDWHESQENGIHMFACGHHASETFGIKSLMARVEEEFDLQCVFIDSDNPA